MEVRPGIVSCRHPKYMLGEIVRRRDFVGFIDTIYLDYWAALDAFIVPEGWFENQTYPISSKDQIFYGIVGDKGKGSILTGENEICKEPF